MSELRTLTRTAHGYVGLHARRNGEPVGPAAYGPWDAYDVLRPVRVTCALAPKVHTAKLALNLPGYASHAWQWAELIAHDDRVAVVSARDPAERAAIFGGFVAEVEWRYGQADEHAEVTCVANAQRLLVDADHWVYGRWMWDAGGTARHYSGLPCSFNAGGRPNRSPAWRTDIAGAPAAGVGVFTHDDAPGAAWWTAADALDYLMWHHNADETWLANATLALTDYDRVEPVVVSCEGLPLWRALALVADRMDYDVHEAVTTDADGLPASEISVTARNGGTERTVKHQAAADATFPDLDLAETDSLTAVVAEGVAACVARPIVAGGRAIIEVTVPLGQAWDGDDLAIPAGEIAGPQYDPSGTYAARYVVGGSSFASYADAGRLWDANTDGRYSDAPYSLSEPDVAALVDAAAGSWPAMPYPPLPMLTRLGALDAGSSGESVLEVSYDGGTTWHALGGYELLPDRLAVRLTTDNLGSVLVPGGTNAFADNLFARLDADASLVKLRLTCSIAAPDRNVYVADRRASAGTAFGAGAWFDRGALATVRSQSAAAHAAMAPLGIDAAIDDGALVRVAEAILAAHEGRSVEAALPIEWPDHELALTDRITRIEGIEYDFGSGAGGLVRYPRVVQLTYHLTPQTYALAVVLDTPRQSGSV